ncbi:membrane protein CrgA [Streptomyces sp. NBRC 110611]|nr:membrane protein CrgA [Streptomyces sp. NBRC 110611]
MIWNFLISARNRDALPVLTLPQASSTVVPDHPSTTSPPAFPGLEHFGPGHANVWVLMLRLRLISEGWADDQRAALRSDPGLWAARAWDEDLRLACARFQLAQGCRGASADGYPDQLTWDLLWTR